MMTKLWSSKWLRLIVVVWLVGCTGSASAGASPPARYAASMASVPTENKAYLFGGRYEGTFGTAYRNDLWAFDYAAESWSPNQNLSCTTKI